MAASENKKKKTELIDPIYQKFSRSVMRALGSTDFYEFFMDMMARAENQFQFSNRKMEKLIDLAWVDAVEESLEGFQNIISNPRNIIREDEIIVNVANAKKAGPDVVRHLAQHGALVENFDEETGDVRPSRLMQKIREDSTELYENRLVYSALEHAFHFVKIRHDALLDAMSEEYGAKLKVESDLECAKELVHVDMFLHIKEKDTALETDEKNRAVFERIGRIYRLLGSFMGSQFAEQMKKVNRIKGGTVTKTNVLKKNPDYKKIVKLWEFLHSYDSVGYVIKITEQNPEINEQLERDIFHNIMFQYIILKGYLEDEEDRELPKPLNERKRTMKPKVVKEIIEELIENYDLPDIEVRKVLIEELTKEQLMLEEEAERRRLVEEAEERKRREEEARKAEEERLRAEQEAEEERLRREKEKEEQRILMEKMERDLEDFRRSSIFKLELEWFEKHRMERLQAREDEAEKWNFKETESDFADAALLIMQAEEQKLAEEERIRRVKEEAEERRLRQLEEARELKLYEAAMKVVFIYKEEAQYFAGALAEQKRQRDAYEEEWRTTFEQAKLEQKKRAKKR